MWERSKGVKTNRFGDLLQMNDEEIKKEFTDIAEAFFNFGQLIGTLERKMVEFESKVWETIKKVAEHRE